MSSGVQTVILNLNDVRGYSKIQRAGFIGVLVGFLLCGIGCFPPYWKSGKLSVPPVEWEVNAGIWIFCLKVTSYGVEQACTLTSYLIYYMDATRETLRIQESSVMWWATTCGASALCLILSLVCGLAACCRVCCCSGGRTIGHGIAGIIAGVSGIVATAVFSSQADAIYGFPVLHVDNGWAVYVFSAGSVMMVISSILLCIPRSGESTSSSMPFVPLAEINSPATLHESNPGYPEINKY